MGKATLSEDSPSSSSSAACPRRRRRACSTRCSSRSPITGLRPQSSPLGSPIRGRRIPAGGDRGRAAGGRQRLPRCRRGHGALPRRGGRRPGRRCGARAGGGRAHPRARTPDPQGGGPAHPADLRDRGRDRAHRLVSRTATRAGRGARAPDGRRTGSRNGAGVAEAKRWPTSDSRVRCCGDSRCWRERRGCSVTSRKRCRALSGCASTARWMSVRSMPRPLGSSGGVQATSEGWQWAFPPGKAGPRTPVVQER